MKSNPSPGIMSISFGEHFILQRTFTLGLVWNTSVQVKKVTITDIVQRHLADPMLHFYTFVTFGRIKELDTQNDRTSFTLHHSNFSISCNILNHFLDVKDGDFVR